MNPSRHDSAYPPRTADGSVADDAAVIRRIADGDETALAVLYDRWLQPVYSLVVHLLKDADEAEDVVEDTFWQIWQRASSYDATRGTARTWILTICRSRALDRLRARQRQREDTSTDINILRDSAPDPSVDAEGAERREMVLSAMDELPHDQRRALELAYFRGLSQSEIADFLNEPLGTIKTRMRLGMQKLHDKLAVLQQGRA